MPKMKSDLNELCKNLKQRLKRCKTKLNEWNDNQFQLEHSILEIKEELKQGNRHVLLLEKAREILQEISTTLQNRAQSKVAAVVAKSLEVFGEGYSFRIDFTPKRGRTAATFVLIKNGMEIDPRDCGGGVLDVISFALRISVVIARRQSRLVILDEPFKFVSVEFRPVMAQLLISLQELLDLQFVFVTHIPELEIGKVNQLT